MSYASASLAYRKAATQHASPVGLVIALYDTLVADLQRASAAMYRNDIQTRSNQLKHGFQVLGQLNALIDTKNGGTPAANLLRFYEHLRRRMLAAQFRQDPAILEVDIRLILEVRAAWQQVDSRAPVPALESRGSSPSSAVEQGSLQSFSCSA